MSKKMLKKSISVLLSVFMTSLNVFGASAEVNVDPVKEKLEGKKILFVGDSITYSGDSSG